MPKLILPPEQSGYAVDFGSDQIRVVDDSPQGKYSRNVFNNAPKVNCTWICDATEYAYIAQAERASRTHGGLRFDVDLLLDDCPSLTTYKAKFVPGTFSLKSVQGETFTVSAQLEIEPLPYNVNILPFVVDSGLSSRILTAPAGVFALSGKVTDRRLKTDKLPSASGIFILTGVDSFRRRATLLPESVGSFALTGQALNLVKNSRLDVSYGAFNLNSQSISIHRGDKYLTAVYKTFNLNGQTVNFNYTSLIRDVKPYTWSMFTYAPGYDATVIDDQDIRRNWMGF